MEYWGVYVIGAVICLLAVLAATPNAWADKILTRYNTHPKLNADSIETINGAVPGENEKQRFVDDFNNAEFRYTYTLAHPMPNFEGQAVHVAANLGSKAVNFTLHPFADHIDVVKQMGKKVIEYRLESTDLQDNLLSGKRPY